MTAKNLLGQTLGPYTIESILGSGGMAVVYRAASPHGESIALKVLFPPPGTETEILTRFEREARTAARLNHPAIVRVIDVGQAEGHPYLAMTLVEGETLTARLARLGYFDEPAATDIAWQIADALYYAHRQGVVHRDVKPSNILLTADNQAHLTDFGVAQALDDTALTRTGHTVGTPAYMAPEQATAEDDVDGRADLYSLGVVLYQMVTGRVPFEGSTPQILHAHVYDSPPPPSSLAHVSPELEAVILKAMAKDVSERFQSGAIMAKALAQLDDQTSLKVPAAPVSTETRSKPSRSQFIGALALLLLAIAVIAGGWLMARSSAPQPTPEANAGQSVNTPAALAPTQTPPPTPVRGTATPIPLPFSEGALLQGSGEGVFRMHADGVLQHVYDWPTFQEFQFDTDEITVAADSALADLPIEELTRLLQAPDQSLDWVIDGQRWRLGRWQPVLAESGYLQLPPSKTDPMLLADLPLAVEANDLPDGTLIKIGDNLYRLFAGSTLRRFATPELAREYGYFLSDFIDIPDEVSHLYAGGPPLTPLLQAEGDSDIYQITNGQRRLMPPKGDDLWALGYALEDISLVPPDFLDNFPVAATAAETATATPSPTPAAVPPGPIATPCPQHMDGALAALNEMELDEALGCPRTESVTTPAAWQPFENGLMLWRADSNLIYGVGPNEAWFITGDRWVEGDDPYDPSIIAPDGYYQPVRGFGLVWRQRPGVRAALGWALAEESGFTAVIQEFTDGQVWHDPNTDRFMILYDSNAYQITQNGEIINRSSPP